MSMSVVSESAQRMPAGPPPLAPAVREEAVKASKAPADQVVKTSLVPNAQVHQGNLEERRKNLTEAIEQLNEQMRQSARNLNFSIDKDSGRTVITVRNSHSGEVVRQIPDEVVLRVAHNIDQVKGMLFNEHS